MTAPFDDSEHARITQSTPDYNSIPWNNDFSKNEFSYTSSKTSEASYIYPIVVLISNFGLVGRQAFLTKVY